MKRISFLLLVLVAVISSHAQIRFGAKAGLNISSIVGKDVEGYGSKAGFFLGGVVNIPVLEQFSIQPEALISLQGAKWEDYDGSTHLSYIHVPVLARYTTRFGLYGETGPQLGFLISAKDKEDGENDDIMEYLKKTDFSWAIGAGYNITPELSVHVRYNAGFTSFYETEKNSVFQLGLTYLFPQRRK